MMMRSLSKNCFAPNTSTSFILSVAWREKSEFVPFPFQSNTFLSLPVVRQLNEHSKLHNQFNLLWRGIMMNDEMNKVKNINTDLQGFE